MSSYAVDRYYAVNRYVNRIRNPIKADYAQDYACWWLEGGREPERPDGLSYMAAQAVRIRVRQLTRATGHEVRRIRTRQSTRTAGHEVRVGMVRLSSQFMRPDVWQGDVWEVSANRGETHYVPIEVEPDPLKLADYVPGTIDTDNDGEWKVKPLTDVWLARLSAPGYLDQTDLAVFGTRAEAEAYLVETYDDDD